MGAFKLTIHIYAATHLRDMIHVSDAYGPTVTKSASIGEDEGSTEINIRKCSKLVEVMDSALRHQEHAYDIQGSPRVLAYIAGQLHRQYPDDEWFDGRCKEILAMESQGSLSLGSGSGSRSTGNVSAAPSYQVQVIA